MSEKSIQQQEFLGHPAGLYALFFAEMWERFSFYGMRALLVFYMSKDFLGYNDGRAYGVYGVYMALVYMTPFLGGLIADRLLGARISVIIGGVLMAMGHLVMTFRTTLLFYLALALIIAGNGFFKPNISAIVGELYPPGSPKRDGGFTIFYMGVNLGAALSPLICGYIGENYGWHWGFGLATVGMLIGLCIFVMPTLVTQVLIGAGALATLFGLYIAIPDNTFSKVVNSIVGLALLVSAGLSIRALTLGGVPEGAGGPPGGKPRFLIPILIGIVVSIPLLALFVSDFSLLSETGEPVKIVSEETIASLKEYGGLVGDVGSVFLEEMSKPAGILISITGLLAFGYLVFETFQLEKVPRERMMVVLILTFFSMLFWAFFEQAGSSVNNFTDRNVDRVTEEYLITAEDVGKTIQIEPTQEQLGYTNGGEMFTLSDLDELRKAHTLGDGDELDETETEAESQVSDVQEPAGADAAEMVSENLESKGAGAEKASTAFTIDWVVDEGNIGMGIANRRSETAASMYQAVNPIYILVFGLAFTALWSFLAVRGIEPATPYKFALGLMQLGCGFGAFWLGAVNADQRGMVAASWLLLGYMFQTTGELCISPVGLSMVTRLSPKILVSTVMGGWFLATSFSHYLAAIISQFTNVSNGGEGERIIPPPIDTVGIYGDVFQKIAIGAIAAGVVCMVLAPLLKKWMHEHEEETA